MPICDFWKHIRLNEYTGCLEWTKGKNAAGYGIVRRSKDFPVNILPGHKHIKAHRLAWVLSVGNIPDYVSVLHRCDNPACCNVEHLFLGTQADNMRDMNNKGRRGRTGHKIGQQVGSKNHNSKLCEDQVIEIKQLLAIGKLSHGEIAKVYGVTRSLISQISENKLWKHIKDVHHDH